MSWLLDILEDSLKDTNIEEYITNNFYIRSKTSGVIPFSLNAEQKIILRQIIKLKKNNKNLKLLIIKGRQVGVSTIISAYVLYRLVFSENIKALILSHKQSSVDNLFNIFINFSENIDLKINKNKNIFTKTDSVANFASAGGKGVGRSDTIQILYGSEVAFWRNEEDHVRSILMAIPNIEGEIILESTSNGPKGLFYNLITGAIEKTNDFEVIFLPWFIHSEYILIESSIIPSKGWIEYGKKYNLSYKQVNWGYSQDLLLNFSKDAIKKAPSRKFLQEFPSTIKDAFLPALENTLIPMGDILKSLEYNKISTYGESKKIILGVDVARGGADSSYIIDRQDNLLGFNVNKKIQTSNSMELVKCITHYIKIFNPSFVCIDAGGGGAMIYDRLKELGFASIIKLIYFASKADNASIYVNKRAEMWGRLKNFIIKNNTFIVKDNALIEELSSVEYFYNYKGQIQLQSKYDIKKIIKRSTDAADAAALTFAIMERDNSTKISVSPYAYKDSLIF